jgi:E3 ubiquitin-protein ligase DOA10
MSCKGDTSPKTINKDAELCRICGEKHKDNRCWPCHCIARLKIYDELKLAGGLGVVVFLAKCDAVVEQLQGVCTTA